MLIAHIDVLHSPDDGNFQLFSQAKRSLQSVMDMLLQPLDPSQLETPTASASADMPPIDWMVSEHVGFDGGFWYVFQVNIVHWLIIYTLGSTFLIGCIWRNPILIYGRETACRLSQRKKSIQ